MGLDSEDSAALWAATGRLVDAETELREYADRWFGEDAPGLMDFAEVDRLGDAVREAVRHRDMLWRRLLGAQGWLAASGLDAGDEQKTRQW
jgi:hypothetical protein